MSWAARRRFVILLILGAIIVAFLSVLGIATFYEAPTCADSIQNQGEAGIDCGGPCAYLCTEQAQPPTVLYTKALNYGGGRTDVIASVENRNAAAAKDVPFRITLYGRDQVLIQEVTGTLDLPPSSAVPVYVPSIASGKRTVASAFLAITETPKWFLFPPFGRSVPLVSNTTLGGTLGAPRIEATLGNPGIAAFTDVRMVVIVHDGKGDVIAASQTVVPTIPATSQATATFTWNSPFSGVPAAIEVVPVIPLP